MHTEMINWDYKHQHNTTVIDKDNLFFQHQTIVKDHIKWLLLLDPKKLPSHPVFPLPTPTKLLFKASSNPPSLQLIVVLLTVNYSLNFTLPQLTVVLLLPLKMELWPTTLVQPMVLWYFTAVTQVWFQLEGWELCALGVGGVQTLLIWAVLQVMPSDWDTIGCIDVW